jgi:hypothetical protein
MTRGRSRKKRRSSRKSSDENDHSQIGQGEEIATPPAQCTSPRRGRPEELTEMNPSNPLQTQPEIGNDCYYAAFAVSPNAHHPKAKFNLDVASWTTTCKATTAGSSLVFEDNVGEDGLSSQLTYKVIIDCLYYKASNAPNPKILNDLKPSIDQLEKVHREL